MSAERKTRRALHQTVYFGTGEVLCKLGELKKVDAPVKDAIVAHFCGVDGQDLQTALFVWKGDLKVDFETTWTQEGFINHVQSVGHTDYENVVELVYTIQLNSSSEV